MSDPGDLLLSVRGEARKIVSPDYATVAATVASSAGSKERAVRAAAEALESLTADLETRGGIALDVSTERRPLTWSAQSVTTREEQSHNDRTGRYERTGNFTATVAVTVTVRDFELLDALLAAHEKVSVHQVTWDVDWDNPAWPEVRADAIQAAIRKGRDYATALGGSLRSVEHIADAGLLSGDSTQHRPTRAVAFGRAAHAAAGDPDAPSLDPVPQELTAIIEARLTADGVSFSSH